MSEQFADFESLLKRALSPVEPPKELEARLEGTLGSLVDMAADELEAWELSAMRDPRNWVRPVAAAAIGSGAAVGLVLVRTQRRRHKRRHEAARPRRPARPHAARPRARGPARRRRRLLIRAGGRRVGTLGRRCPTTYAHSPMRTSCSWSGAGRRPAFEVIYERHSQAAFSLAYRMAGSRGVAEDVVQEAFLNIWRSGARYERSRGSVRTWVLGIVHHRGIDALRRSFVHERRRASDEGLEETHRDRRAHRRRGRAPRGGAPRCAPRSGTCRPSRAR